MRTRAGTPVVRVVVGALAFSLAVTSPALAQEEPSATDIAAARSLGQEGVKLADAGSCQEAVDKLARAEKIFHAPTTLARLGECQVQIGKIVEGTENLNKVAREVLAPGAPQAFVQAQERAKRVLADAKPKIAKLKIAVAGPADATWTVKVDGDPIPLANLNTNRPMDPGEHVVEAFASGYKPARAKVTLPEGGIDSVALTLEIDPTAPKAPPAPPPRREGGASTDIETPAPSEVPQPPSRVPAYVALGVGAVGIGVGTVFGLMATSKKSDLESACGPERRCDAAQQDVIDTGKSFGTVSTVGFVIGAVGLVAGAYLYLTSSSSSSAMARSTTAGPQRGVFVGADRIGLSF